MKQCVSWSQKRRAKVENLQHELTRIRSKESSSDGLTEGQQHHIRKLEEKIEELQEQIADNEETLRSRNVQRQASGKKSRKRGGGEDDDDYNTSEDEFFDRTSVAAKK